MFVGEVVSEDDKPIKHTKNQDAVWFTLTIIGAPLLVLDARPRRDLGPPRAADDDEADEVTP